MELINKNDKIFIAGHNGMVGKSIFNCLKTNGYQKLITSPRNKLDLRNLIDVQKWFLENKPKIVIIAAAKVGGILANKSYPVDFLIDNLKIQNNLIETSWKMGVKRLLFLGSSCIYPKFSSQPIKEESLLTGTLEKTNESYAIAKIAGIKLCESLRKQYGFDAISLMPTNLYGPGDNYQIDNSHVIPALLRRFHEAKEKNKSVITCWGTGTPYREFLHAADLGNACKFVLENWDPKSKEAPLDSKGNPLTWLNVGTGLDISIKELAETIASTINYQGEIEWDHSKPDGTPKKQLDISKIKKLGWEPTISLKEGLINTYEIFCKELKTGIKPKLRL